MSVFRNTVWFLKGLKEYTSSGYTSASANFNESDLQLKCEDRSYLITGMIVLVNSFYLNALMLMS